MSFKQKPVKSFHYIKIHKPVTGTYHILEHTFNKANGKIKKRTLFKGKTKTEADEIIYKLERGIKP